jgi:hypothetical protein
MNADGRREEKPRIPALLPHSPICVNLRALRIIGVPPLWLRLRRPQPLRWFGSPNSPSKKACPALRPLLLYGPRRRLGAPSSVVEHYLHTDVPNADLLSVLTELNFVCHCVCHLFSLKLAPGELGQPFRPSSLFGPPQMKSVWMAIRPKSLVRADAPIVPRLLALDHVAAESTFRASARKRAKRLCHASEAAFHGTRSREVFPLMGLGNPKNGSPRDEARRQS